jgi:hypothetical protein
MHPLLKLTFLISTFAHHALAMGSSIADDLEELVRTERSTRDDQGLLKRRLRDHYDSTLNPISAAPLDVMSSDDVRRVFLAARIVLLHDHTDRYLSDMEAMFNLLISRGAPAFQEARELYAGMVFLRRFEAARRLAESYRVDVASPLPHLRNLPEVRSRHHRVMTATSLGELEIRHWTPPAERSILVVAGPDCARSRKAVLDIAGDKDLAAIFDRSSVWLAPPTLSGDMGRTMDWLRDGVRQNRFAVFAEEDWPEVDMYETPVFFVMENGVVKNTIRGWRPPASMAELKKALLSETPDVSNDEDLSPP